MGGWILESTMKSIMVYLILFPQFKVRPWDTAARSRASLEQQSLNIVSEKRIEISCQEPSRKPEHTEQFNLQGNKILKLHKNRIRALNPNVFVLLTYNSLQVSVAVAERMGSSFSCQAPLFHHSWYRAVDMLQESRVPSCGDKNGVEMAT